MTRAETAASIHDLLAASPLFRDLEWDALRELVLEVVPVRLRGLADIRAVGLRPQRVDASA